MSDFFDRDGDPMAFSDWRDRFGDWEYRNVAQDQVGRSHVSTVWIGINYRRIGPGPPLIFETMITGGIRNAMGFRYSTITEARKGHRKIVAELREGK